MSSFISGNMLIRLGGLSFITSCIGFILFLVLYGIFLPVNTDNSNYTGLLLNRNWIWVNLIQLFAIITGIFGTFGLVVGLIENLQWLGLVGLIITVSGYVFMTGTSFTETFAWSTLAQFITPEQIMQPAGQTLKNTPFITASMVGFHLFAIGYFLIGLGLFLNTTSPKWLPLCLMAGSFLFSLSFIIGGTIRYKLNPLAALIMLGGLIPLGIKLLK